MKTLSKYYLLLVFSLILTSLCGQDIFYTISGEINDQKVGLDSILFENLQNGTRHLFDNLSDQSDYVINLTTQTLSGATGLDDMKFENGFSLLSNTNGNISIGCNYPSIKPINISIYNVQGQSLYVSSPLYITDGNSIHINLAKHGVYLVKIESSIGSKTFKAKGSSAISVFSVKLNYQKPRNNASLKSSLNTYDSDFSFEIGDRISVSVYKNGYWASSNIHQISSSIPISFAFRLSTPFTDTRDDQIYTTIEIGSQVWMVENLKYLPAVVGPETGSVTEPYYYVYGYDGTDVTTAKSEPNYRTYGVLYNWPAAMNSAASSTSNPSAVQGACPSGWHLPSNSEWIQLADYLINNGFGYGGSGNDIAKSMASTSGWGWYSNSNPYSVSNDQSSNNSSGFDGFPVGCRSYTGSFGSLSYTGYWWSSSESSGNSTIAWYRALYGYYDQLGGGLNGKSDGFSVRCLKD